ncbi:hypothetical protein MPSEU_000388400 [Mayamaea pseudoterrestris]|nr:hypothetical protein MPSEU_000388400 [Mayamaea pseudoterrestris]
MMDQSNLSSLLSTAFFAGFISLAIYMWFIHPYLPMQQQRHAPPAPSPQLQQEQQDKSASSTSKASQVPSHVSDQSAKIASSNGQNLLRDGLVAFVHTRAATDQETLSLHRTDRATVLAKLTLYSKVENENGSIKTTQPVLISPPAKGSIVIVAVPVTDVGCTKLHRVLYLLATYYNLILVLGDADESHANDAAAYKASLVQQLRTAQEHAALSSAILPNHRIILSSTITGRVALVRQVEKAELVLDYDVQVEQQLERFNRKVITYGGLSSCQPKREGVSALGGELLSQ